MSLCLLTGLEDGESLFMDHSLIIQVITSAIGIMLMFMTCKFNFKKLNENKKGFGIKNCLLIVQKIILHAQSVTQTN